MKIKMNNVHDVTVISLNGDLNINTTGALRRALDQCFDANKRKIVIDFKESKYIDSCGLALLIEMLQKFKAGKGAISLANMDDKLKNLFEITKIDMLMSIYGSQEDAVSSL